MRLKILAGVLLALSVSGGALAQKWERLGPEGGMVQSLGAGAGNQIYLGTSDGHVFASGDGARSWELRGRVGSRLDAVVTHIVAEPGQSNQLFASVWYQQPGTGGGVFESADQGQNWKSAGLEGEAVRALEMAPSRPEELIAGTLTGVFLSPDGGKNWQRISPEGDEELRNVDSLAIDPRDPQVIYVGTYHLPWLTRDGGKSWKPVIAGIIDDSDIMSLRLDATNPDRVYMSACSGIYRSENQGGEWIKLQGIPYAARRTQVIVQDQGSPKTLYAGTTEGLWVTRDGGENWSRTTSKDWVVNSVLVLSGKNGAPGRIVLGTEGRGIQVSDDAGLTFTEANHGFTHVIVKQLVQDQRDPGRLLMIEERSGPEILESRDEGKHWTKVPLTVEGRGKTTTLNADQVQEVRGSPTGWVVQLENGELWRREESKEVWREWKLVLPAATRRSAKGASTRTAQGVIVQQLAPDAAMAFSRDGAVVSAGSGLLRCRVTGSCEHLKAYNHGKIRAVWRSADGRDTGAVMDGKLGWSEDGGETASWRDLPVSAEQISWIDADESGGGKRVYLGTSQGIFVEADVDGDWKRVEGGLPAGQVGQWLRGSMVWVVNERDGGIYISQDKGDSWSRVDHDSERSRLTGLVELAGGGILAGSQSEGLLLLELEGKRGSK
ncbi:MAG: hypothetical protein WBR26_24410 [Candidatus Acidiferrum sp.]